MRKISFLMAAHNEEKIIGKTLNNLIRIPYKNYEVVVGLDGCTDKTEEIVRQFCKKSRKVKYYKLNLRQGKPAVINSIIKKARGEIIIINDADWLFTVKDARAIRQLAGMFDNPKIGGIAESFPVEWDADKIRRGNFGFKISAYSSFLWYKFQKERFTEKKHDYLKVKEPALFMTNIFRKKLYRENKSLADDFERTKDILDLGYEIIVFKETNVPRMIVVYDEVKIRDLFKQKIRTAMARNQIKNENEIGGGYYTSAVFYILKNSWKLGIKIGLMMIFWVLLTSSATVIAKFRDLNTKEGWKLRMER